MRVVRLKRRISLKHRWADFLIISFFRSGKHMAWWVLLFLLLCSTQPNSQMASTMGEEGVGEGGRGGSRKEEE